jgi:hypothetical protein
MMAPFAHDNHMTMDFVAVQEKWNGGAKTRKGRCHSATAPLQLVEAQP